MKVYEIIAQMHNALGLTEPMEIIPSRFYSRPYLKLQPASIITEMRAAIKDPMVKSILTNDTKGIIGSVDQWADSTDILSNTRLCHKLQQFYLEKDDDVSNLAQ